MLLHVHVLCNIHEHMHAQTFDSDFGQSVLVKLHTCCVNCYIMEGQGLVISREVADRFQL